MLYVEYDSLRVYLRIRFTTMQSIYEEIIMEDNSCRSIVYLVFHYYRPQTKFAKVMFLHASVCPQRGGGVCLPHCILEYTPSRYPLGVDMPPLGIHPPWTDTPQAENPRTDTPLHSACWDMVNKRVVRIPLECNLALRREQEEER